MTITSFTYEADIHCLSCTKKRFPILFSHIGDKPAFILTPDITDSEGNPPHPVFSTEDEADTPQHCCDCGVFLENQLTHDGMKYVRDKIAEHKKSGRGAAEVINEWEEYYALTPD